MRIIELVKEFGNFKIEIENLELKPGLIHGLIGPNGCGKTTLAKLLAGTIAADRIMLDLDGLNARDITMTSQKPYMMRDTVINNLLYPLKLRGINPNIAEVGRLLRLCGLEGREKTYARSLSSGQQQKLSVARALIFLPKLIIIDESFSNLDLDSLEAFEHELLQIQSVRPVTWIIISHQMPLIRNLCDMLHFMADGRVLKSGTPAEIFNCSAPFELVRFLKREF